MNIPNQENRNGNQDTTTNNLNTMQFKEVAWFKNVNQYLFGQNTSKNKASLINKSTLIGEYREYNKRHHEAISSQPGAFKINDIWLTIPPENISVSISGNTYDMPMLRSKSSVKIDTGHSEIQIGMRVQFAANSLIGESIDSELKYKLVPILTQLKKMPFCYVKNAYLHKKVIESIISTGSDSMDYFANREDDVFKNHLLLTYMGHRTSTATESPDVVTVDFSFLLFNYLPYMSSVLFASEYKKDSNGTVVKEMYGQQPLLATATSTCTSLELSLPFYEFYALDFKDIEPTKYYKHHKPLMSSVKPNTPIIMKMKYYEYYALPGYLFTSTEVQVVKGFADYHNWNSDIRIEPPTSNNGYTPDLSIEDYQKILAAEKDFDLWREKNIDKSTAFVSYLRNELKKTGKDFIRIHPPGTKLTDRTSIANNMERGSITKTGKDNRSHIKVNGKLVRNLKANGWINGNGGLFLGSDHPTGNAIDIKHENIFYTGGFVNHNYTDPFIIAMTPLCEAIVNLMRKPGNPAHIKYVIFNGWDYKPDGRKVDFTPINTNKTIGMQHLDHIHVSLYPTPYEMYDVKTKKYVTYHNRKAAFYQNPNSSYSSNTNNSGHLFGPTQSVSSVKDLYKHGQLGVFQVMTDNGVTVNNKFYSVSSIFTFMASPAFIAYDTNIKNNPNQTLYELAKYFQKYSNEIKAWKNAIDKISGKNKNTQTNTSNNTATNTTQTAPTATTAPVTGNNTVTTTAPVSSSNTGFSNGLYGDSLWTRSVNKDPNPNNVAIVAPQNTPMVMDPKYYGWNDNDKAMRKVIEALWKIPGVRIYPSDNMDRLVYIKIPREIEIEHNGIQLTQIESYNENNVARIPINGYKIATHQYMGGQTQKVILHLASYHKSELELQKIISVNNIVTNNSKAYKHLAAFDGVVIEDNGFINRIIGANTFVIDNIDIQTHPQIPNASLVTVTMSDFTGMKKQAENLFEFEDMTLSDMGSYYEMLIDDFKNALSISVSSYKLTTPSVHVDERYKTVSKYISLDFQPLDKNNYKLVELVKTLNDNFGPKNTFIIKNEKTTKTTNQVVKSKTIHYYDQYRLIDRFSYNNKFMDVPREEIEQCFIHDTSSKVDPDSIDDTIQRKILSFIELHSKQIYDLQDSSGNFLCKKTRSKYSEEIKKQNEKISIPAYRDFNLPPTINPDYYFWQIHKHNNASKNYKNNESNSLKLLTQRYCKYSEQLLMDDAATIPLVNQIERELLGPGNQPKISSSTIKANIEKEENRLSPLNNSKKYYDYLACAHNISYNKNQAVIDETNNGSQKVKINYNPEAEGELSKYPGIFYLDTGANESDLNADTDGNKSIAFAKKYFESQNDNMIDASVGLMAAFPVYKIFIVERDDEEFAYPFRNDLNDLFGMNAIQEIRLVQHSDQPADLLVVRFVDMTGKFTSAKYKQYSITEKPKTSPTVTDTIEENPLKGLILQEGTSVQCRAGYSNSVDDLPVLFNGYIVSVEGDNGDFTMMCQSYGAELVHDIKYPDEAKDPTDFNAETKEILQWCLDQPEVKHFGRWKVSDASNLQFSDDKKGYQAFYYNRIRPDGKEQMSWTWAKSEGEMNCLAPDERASVGMEDIWQRCTNSPISSILSILKIWNWPNYLFKGIFKQFFIKGSTIWQVLDELTFRYPTYVTKVLPFDERCTLYWGPQDGFYYYKSLNLDQKEKLNYYSEGNTYTVFRDKQLKKIKAFKEYFNYMVQALEKHSTKSKNDINKYKEIFTDTNENGVTGRQLYETFVSELDLSSSEQYAYDPKSILDNFRKFLAKQKLLLQPDFSAKMTDEIKSKIKPFMKEMIKKGILYNPLTVGNINISHFYTDLVKEISKSYQINEDAAWKYVGSFDEEWKYENDLKKKLTKTVAELKEDIRNTTIKATRTYHICSSMKNLCTNNISADFRDCYTEVQIGWVDEAAGGKEILKGNPPSEVTVMKMNDFLEDEDVRSKYIVATNATTVTAAHEFGAHALWRESKKLYKGSVITLGNANIKPLDIMFMLDHANQTYGPVEVRQHILTISPNEGMISDIEPSMVSTVRNIVTMSNMDALNYIAAGRDGIETMDKGDSFMTRRMTEQGTAVTAFQLMTGGVVTSGLGATSLALMGMGGLTMLSAGTAALAIPVGLMIAGIGIKMMLAAKYRNPIILHPLIRHGSPYLHGMNTYKTAGLLRWYDEKLTKFNEGLDVFGKVVGYVARDWYNSWTE